MSIGSADPLWLPLSTSHLPLKEVIQITLLSTTLRWIAFSPLLTPFSAPVHRVLLRGPPYPVEITTLGSYTHIARSVFIEILVRGEARWVLEDLEIPHLRDQVWEEVFKRRFLPSWTRYKEEGEKWRAVTMRMLRRLVHRTVGCTHDEPWTVSFLYLVAVCIRLIGSVHSRQQRFLTLHRNGSGSLNRMYSRTFDPHEIFREIKNQNNLSDRPTEVRLLLQLQDVRILLFGVLAPPRSVFVNENAFRLCHPPRMGWSADGSGVGWERVVNEDGYPVDQYGEGLFRPAVETSTSYADGSTRVTEIRSGANISHTRRHSETFTDIPPHEPGLVVNDRPQRPRSSTLSTFALPRTFSNQGSLTGAAPAVTSPGPSSHLEPPRNRTRSGSQSSSTRRGLLARLGTLATGSGVQQSRLETHNESSLPGEVHPASTPGSTSSAGSRNRRWLNRISSRDSQDGRSSGGRRSTEEEGLSVGNGVGGDNERTHTGTVPFPSTSEEEVSPEVPREQGSGARQDQHKVPRYLSPDEYGEDLIDRLPYAPLSHPLPAPSHALYPNYTEKDYMFKSVEKRFPLDPVFSDSDNGGKDDHNVASARELNARRNAIKSMVDTRQLHAVLKERRWLQGVLKDGGNVIPSEWVVGDQGEMGVAGGQAMTWVGPAL